MDVNLFLTWILLFCGIMVSSLGASQEEETKNGRITRDYCAAEHFEARCAPGTLILVHKAFYGRMRFGRCITKQFQEDGGCHADVTTYVNPRCTGQHNCSIPVGIMNSIAAPCPKDYSMYMEVTHECVEDPRAYCGVTLGQQNTISVTSEGYLALYPSMLARQGPCHWNLLAEGGRKLRFKLISDLSVASQLSSSSAASSDGTGIYCDTKLTFKEGTSITAANLCPDNQQDQVTLYSTTSSQAVRIEASLKHPPSSALRDLVPILIQYKVFGCRDIIPPEGAIVRHSPQGVVVICNQTIQLETWYLTCKDDKWIGEFENCSKSGHSDQMPTLPSTTDKDIQNGIVLAVLVGVILGVMVGACMLCVIFVVRRSKRRNSRNRATGDELQYETRMRNEEPCDLTYPSLLRHEKGMISPSDYEHVCTSAYPVTFKANPDGSQMLKVQVGQQLHTIDSECKFDRTLISPERIKLPGYHTKPDGSIVTNDPMTYYDLEPQIGKQQMNQMIPGMGGGRPDDSRVILRDNANMTS